MTRLRFWIHEKMHAVAVYLFGAKTLFRYQCLCGASILKEIPQPLKGAAFTRGGSFDISFSNGTVVRVGCIFCNREYELVWNGFKQQFTIAVDDKDHIPEEVKFKVTGTDGTVIANGVSRIAAQQYQNTYSGSKIDVI